LVTKHDAEKPENCDSCETLLKMRSLYCCIMSSASLLLTLLTSIHAKRSFSPLLTKSRTFMTLSLSTSNFRALNIKRGISGLFSTRGNHVFTADILCNECAIPARAVVGFLI